MKVNPNALVRVERCLDLPILIVDDFYLDAPDVREYALHARYDVSQARYPGLNAPLTTALISDVVVAITAIIGQLADFTLRAEDIDSDFSVLTMAPDDFMPAQRHPHIDPGPLLGLVYLTPGSTVGTSFYYSEILGFAAAHTNCDRRSHERLLAELAADPAAEQMEINSPQLWRRIHSIEPVFNRFVLFPGNILHAIDVKQEEFHRGADRVRLTQRFVVRRVWPRATEPDLVAHSWK